MEQSAVVSYQGGKPLKVILSRLANLAFSKPRFEILALKISLTFFSVKKGLALAKHCLSYIFITNLFWWGSMTMQGLKNIAKILL